MIYTITTNPSLDYTVEADLIPGQINRTRSEVIYPGGKGINVSLFLQRLGMETLVLGFAAGRIGQAIRDLLDDLGCPHEAHRALRRRAEPDQRQIQGHAGDGGERPGSRPPGGGQGAAGWRGWRM